MVLNFLSVCIYRTAVKDRIVAFLLFLGKILIVSVIGELYGKPLEFSLILCNIFQLSWPTWDLVLIKTKESSCGVNPSIITFFLS